MNKEQLNEILDSYKWIKVKKHDVCMSGNEGEKYMELYNHHSKETEFLIKKCREIATELLEAEEVISFYKERVKNKNNGEWNWAAFDYNKGYKDAENKYLKIIKQKEEEIKKLEEKHEDQAN